MNRQVNDRQMIYEIHIWICVYVNTYQYIYKRAISFCTLGGAKGKALMRVFEKQKIVAKLHSDENGSVN